LEAIMPIRSILVPMNAFQSDRGTLDLALAVARPTNAHIRVAFVRPDPRDAAVYAGFGTEGIGLGRLMDQIEKDGAEYSARARAVFDAWCARNNVSEFTKARAGRHVSADWHDETGPSDQIIAKLGGLTDLIVETGLYDDKLPLEQSTIEASLFGSGRPVLIAPKAAGGGLGETALIAWNGSREANRTVGAALELLGACKKALIFCEPEGRWAQPQPDDLINFLGWHGIAAQRVAGAATAGSIGANLLATAAREHAGLLVMGAYTHGRFREMVLGGVTDHVLHHATIPVLLAH
jgi:nucleotide-binding universal stress UspA family protein